MSANELDSGLFADLNTLASKYVGDGCLPNAYFVTVVGKVRAIYADEQDAIRYANSIYNATATVEDRLTGVVYDNPAACREQESLENE